MEGEAAGLELQVARLTRELEAARAELDATRQSQAASAEVLKVISGSAFDLATVLQTLVDSAIRLCGADMGAITLREGDTLRFKAGSAQTAELLDYERAHPHPIGRGTFQGRAALDVGKVPRDHLEVATAEPGMTQPIIVGHGRCPAVLGAYIWRRHDSPPRKGCIP